MDFFFRFSIDYVRFSWILRVSISYPGFLIVCLHRTEALMFEDATRHRLEGDRWVVQPAQCATGNQDRFTVDIQLHS